MLKKILILTFMLLFVSGCEKVEIEDSIRWVTIADIEKSLESQPPMNIGFDVDDTVLFSSAGFHYGQRKYSPGSSEFMQSEAFWEEMNNDLDKFSMPKECAERLIEIHKKRGDTIYFITARPATKTETLTDYLADIFALENPNKVIFTGFKRGENFKIEPIKKLNIQIFYGDSDTDIEAAQASGKRAIRIIRAENTKYKPLPEYGALGEEVLVDSGY